MPTICRTTDRSHQWTQFELNALLGLMIKGMHLHGKIGRNEDAGRVTQNAYLNVATALNKALNGESNYGNDIDKKEVTRMIDKLLVEKKAVVGKGGYMDRMVAGRMTRGLRMMFQRYTKFDFDGSLREWNLWRKVEEAEKLRISQSGAPKNTDGLNVEMLEPSHSTLTDPTTTAWEAAELAASSTATVWNMTHQATPFTSAYTAYPQTTSPLTSSHGAPQDGARYSATHQTPTYQASQEPDYCSPAQDDPSLRTTLSTEISNARSSGGGEKYPALKSAHKYPVRKGNRLAMAKLAAAREAHKQ